jgi:hypothetical protein
VQVNTVDSHSFELHWLCLVVSALCASAGGAKAAQSSTVTAALNKTEARLLGTSVTCFSY